jgi:acyl transferase domain-containing protein
MKDNKTLSPDAIAIQRWLVSKLAERLKLSSESIDPRQTFVHYSLGSLAAVELSDELGEWLGRAVSPTLIYDYPSPDALACHLAREQTDRQVTPEAGSPSSEVADEGIAVIGMGCRFPGARGPGVFWELLRDGVDAITEVPLDRWDINSYYDPTAGTPGKMSTRWGGFLEAVDVFDHEFFSISPLEAASMDPQQRLLLEVGWESLEHAGLVPKSLAGTSTGVFIGISSNDYARLHAEANAYAGTGNALSIAANRLSYLLDLRGPSWAVDTACSSSLVAVHQACQSLRNRECSLALAGGVNLILSPQVTVAFSQAQMMAADGRCKTFDAAADGYVRSEGCGLVVLKRLADAQRDGDSILAVIRGSAVNHDGGSNGLTAPSGPAQQEVIHQALAAAELSPEQVSYIEAHGTGTLLGDPIEVQALGAVFAPGRSPEHPLLLGSVKANIGHLEAAAGIAGLIKTVLALQHRLIPSQLHFKTPNPHIAWPELSLRVPADNYIWPRNGTPLFAGVSSFGFGGTNAHVIVEQAPAGTQSPPLPLPQLLFLSTKTPDALRALAQRYRDDLETLPKEHLAPLCVSSHTQRTHFSERLAVVASSTKQLRQELAAFVDGETREEVTTGRVIPWHPLPLVFLFTGQGSQYIGMGRELYESEPVFRTALEQCAQLMDPHLEKPLLTLLYSVNSQNETLQQTACTQPTLFALQYALVRLWQSWGIGPAAVFGHSIGEFAAAYSAGVLSLEDAVLLVLHRSRLMQALPANGKMAVVLAPAAQVAAELKTIPEQITVAAVNSPTQTVLSGESSAILSACAHFENLGFSTQQIAISHAFHSPLMSPVLEGLEALVRSVTLKTPEVHFVSSVSGNFVTTELTDPDYWLQQVIQPVRFAEGMATLQNEGFRTFLEIGPSATLLALGRACLAEDYAAAWLASLRPGQSERQQILQSLAALYVRGAEVGGPTESRMHSFSWMKLPTYPFQGKPFPRPSVQPVHANSLAENNLTKLAEKLQNTQQFATELADEEEFSPEELRLLPRLLSAVARRADLSPTKQECIYRLSWLPRALPTFSILATSRGTWLVFCDNKERGDILAERLRQQNQDCLLVYTSKDFTSQAPGVWGLDPSQAEHFTQLANAIAEVQLQGVMYLWSLQAPATEALDEVLLEQSQALCCVGVLHLTQMLSLRPDSCKLWLVSRSAVSVDEMPRPLALNQAPLWGMGKVIALEHPELWGGSIDLDAEPWPNEEETLLAVVSEETDEEQQAFRQGQRYVARLVKAEPPIPRTLDLSGTCLITGGLGALGLKVAGWLVQQGVSSLALVGRRAPSEEARVAIAAMEQCGARVLVLAADVCDRQQMTWALDEIAAKLLPLQGIVHAAGVPGFQTITALQSDEMLAVLRPKVLGSWVLHQLSQGLDLKLFVCFSSISSLWGSKGQAHYAAANHFLDALAHYRHGLGLPALSINWGSWNHGMALPELQRYLNRIGIRALQPEEALENLGALLATNWPQAAVVPVDWGVFRDIYEVRGSGSLFSLLPSYTAASSEHTRPGMIRKKIEAAPSGERQRLLLKYLYDEVAQILQMESGTLLDSQTGFAQMGMDSLMAIELRNRLQDGLGCTLPATLAFETSNIEQLASHLAHKVFDWQAPEQTTTDTHEQSLAKVEQTTVEGIKADIAQELATIEQLIRGTSK